MSFSVESDDCCEWDICTHLLSVFTFPGHGSLRRTVPQRTRLMSPLGPGASLLTLKPSWEARSGGGGQTLPRGEHSGWAAEWWSWGGEGNFYPERDDLRPSPGKVTG